VAQTSHHQGKGPLVRKPTKTMLLPFLSLLIPAALAASGSQAQTSIEVDVQGILCLKPIDAEQFQQLASTHPAMSRAMALRRFNRTRDTARCKWYDRTLMIFKGVLRETGGDGESRPKDLFIGGKGGVFEILVYEVPDGGGMLYSWRRTDGDAG